MKYKIKQFSLVAFLVFASHATLMTQIIPYLTHVGYNASQRGYILSFYALLSIVGQIIVGYLSDKQLKIKPYFIHITYIFLVSGLLSYQFDQASYAYHFFVIGIMAGMVRIAGNLYETWVLEVDGLFHEFGQIRAWGSIGWGVFSLISGAIVTQFGFQILGIGATLMSIAALYFTYQLEDAHKEPVGSVSFRDIKILLKNPQYILLIFAYTIAFLVYNADGITVIDKIFLLGGNSQSVGVKWFITAITEVPLLFLSGRLLLKYKAKPLMVFASVVLGVRFVLYAWASSVTAIMIVNILQMLTFPLILTSQKDLIFHEVPANLKSTGQMFAISISTGLSAVFTPIISAQLVNAFGMDHTLLILGAMMLVCVACMLIYKPKQRNS